MKNLKKIVGSCLFMVFLSEACQKEKIEPVAPLNLKEVNNSLAGKKNPAKKYWQVVREREHLPQRHDQTIKLKNNERNKLKSNYVSLNNGLAPNRNFGIGNPQTNHPSNFNHPHNLGNLARERANASSKDRWASNLNNPNN